MRALVMTEPSPGPDRTQVQSIAEPSPGPGQVSIDVRYAGLNFMDVMARRGDPGYAAAWPYVPGLEITGTVRGSGPDVEGLAPGTAVAAFTRGGGMAEIAVTDARLVVPLPESVPMASGAAAPLMLSTALLLLTDAAHFGAGDTVLMHSASGGVGSAVAQLVAALGGGLRIGTVGRADKIDDARRSGWDVVLVRDDDLPQQVKKVAADGVDVVLDPAGTSLIDVDLAVAAPGARIALFGNPGGGKPAPLPPLGSLIKGNVALAGFSMSNLTVAAPLRAADALRRALDFLAAKSVSLPISQLAALEEVPAVHQLLAEGRGTGKYVVEVPGRTS